MRKLLIPAVLLVSAAQAAQQDVPWIHEMEDISGPTEETMEVMRGIEGFEEYHISNRLYNLIARSDNSAEMWRKGKGIFYRMCHSQYSSKIYVIVESFRNNEKETLREIYQRFDEFSEEEKYDAIMNVHWLENDPDGNDFGIPTPGRSWKSKNMACDLECVLFKRMMNL